METIGAIIYFASILGALPIFLSLELLALSRLRGWRRLLLLIPAAYVGWALLGEFAPLFLHWRAMDSAEFRRLLYERWSAASRPALYANAVVLALLVLRKPRR